jgi:hypothetical protein
MTELVLLHAEDRHRMTRLYEEVLTRLEEMAMITARNLCLNSGAVSGVCFSPLDTPEDGESNAIELVRGAAASGCYDYSRGVCFQYDRLTAISE